MARFEGFRLKVFDAGGDPLALLGDDAEVVEPNVGEEVVDVLIAVADFAPAIFFEQPLKMRAGALERVPSKVNTLDPA